MDPGQEEEMEQEKVAHLSGAALGAHLPPVCSPPPPEFQVGTHG